VLRVFGIKQLTIKDFKSIKYITYVVISLNRSRAETKRCFNLSGLFINPKNLEKNFGLDRNRDKKNLLVRAAEAFLSLSSLNGKLSVTFSRTIKCLKTFRSNFHEMKYEMELL